PKGPPPDDRPRFHVHALPERAHLRIRFPVVEGYAFALRGGAIRADVTAIEPLALDPVQAPQAVFVMPRVGVQHGLPSLAGGFQTEMQDRAAYYASTHLQTIQFEIAREVVRRLIDASDGERKRAVSGHVLFPQVFRIVDEFVRSRVDLRGCDEREIGLDRYSGEIAERVFAAIRPDESAGEPPLLPLLNRYRAVADTSVVDFKTVKPCFATRKSHINHVASDTDLWEQAAAFALEASDHVVAYARNDHLECVIPYEYHGLARGYRPDFLVRLVDGTTLILEIKGYETNEDRAKHEAASRWVAAVNNWRKLGLWRRRVCRDPQQLGKVLKDIVTMEVLPRAKIDTIGGSTRSMRDDAVRPPREAR
ncbi:MAG: restriction endonuclease, partial [Longimicrobiales bacterium]